MIGNCSQRSYQKLTGYTKYHSSGLFQILDSLLHRISTVDLTYFESMLIKFADDREPEKAASILKDRTSIQSNRKKQVEEITMHSGKGKYKLSHSGKTNAQSRWLKALQKMIWGCRGWQAEQDSRMPYCHKNTNKPDADPGHDRGKGNTKWGQEYTSTGLPDVWKSYGNIRYSLRK